MSRAPDLPDHGPQFPSAPLAVAILGAGSIARTAHIPAYEKYGVPVTGVYSRNRARTEDLPQLFPSVRRIYRSTQELLEDPAVEIVDLATGPEDRVDLIARAVQHGKHVLAQKPLLAGASDVAALRPVLDEAAERGLRIAVNQNARWAPVWRLATLLLRQGEIGDVVGVTHLHDKPLPPIAGTPFDDIDHMLIADYMVHWTDITRCWLEGTRVTHLSARDSRVPGQPETARNPWHADVRIGCDNGASAALRVVGDVQATNPGCPFWIHGTRGTLRGSILGGTDRLELDRDGEIHPLPLHGEWFVDGFAGTMAELMNAIREDREPENSAVHVLPTVELTDAARDSARHGGMPRRLDIALTPSTRSTTP
ncbi:Gfo/Idh/MocA family protein [Brachybacterium sp. UNK5269]|uniref:Gfo/Idh/MocA family protein n=1 Tax=Brachybacterium sp. UNK5269 TaxID=3408576 RepID=UPI003BB069C2